jgi:hypothetical protein
MMHTAYLIGVVLCSWRVSCYDQNSESMLEEYDV